MLTCLPLIAVAPAPAQPDSAIRRKDETHAKGGAAPRSLDLSSPRATMRTFLVAVQDAAGDRPERIDDAVKCLDISGLEGDDRQERARLLVRRLQKIIDAKGVNLDDIPDPATDTDEYVFFRTEPSGEKRASRRKKPRTVIAIARDEASEDWLFSEETVASIPTLEASIDQQAKASTAGGDSVPVARRSARATMTTFIEAMNAEPPDMEAAVLCLDPTGQDVQAWGVRSRELAITLKTVMDKIKVAVLAEIPDDADGPPYVWHADKSGNIVLARIESATVDVKDARFALREGEWRFTAQTLKTIDALYRASEGQQIVAALKQAGVKERLTFRQRIEREMPEWLRADAWFLVGWQWLVLALLLLLGLVVRAVAGALFAFSLRRWLRTRRLEIERTSQRRVAGAVGALAAVTFWHFAIRPLGLPPALLSFLMGATKLALGVTGVWAAYRFVDVVGGQIASDRQVSVTRFDDVLIPMLQKILRVFVVIAAILIVAEWMGWKVSTILGALGIGGVALAFAAQDTIGNFFGSITVLFDRPFGIGDWIVIGDVEGTVERVGFRSTRVRTFYNSMVTIPNSKMVNTQVDNYGARRYRRARVMLSLTYDTPPEKIDAFCEGIRELIRLHPYTRKDYYHVYFHKFADSSLNILLYTFFEVPDWGTELRERHRLFVDILRLADRLGVEFAFPTQTVVLQRPGRSGTAPAGASGVVGDPDEIGLDEAANLYEQVYGDIAARRKPVVIETSPRSKRAREARSRGGGAGPNDGQTMP